MNPERRCRERIHKKLSSGVYAQAMGGTMTRGTPDAYYEGNRRILWAEWKWTSSLRPLLIPDPEPLQKRWLRRAYGNGIAVAVICSSPVLTYVFEGLSWESRRIVDATLAGTDDDIVKWIEDHITR